MVKQFGIVALAAALAVLGGCGDDSEGTTQTPIPTHTATALPTATPTATPPCQFHAGALPADTLPAAAPHGAQIPIDQIIVLMQENRSFDSYFGQLPAAGVANVDGLPSTASNPDSDGTSVPAFHQTPYCIDDVSHSWSGSHQEFDRGANDGFVVANNPNGTRAMGYYDQSDLPFYYALAKQFAIGDRYFCSLLGPTFPNRFYLLTGTSFGHIQNDLVSGGLRQRAIFDVLDEHHISWKVYYGDIPFAGFALHVTKRANEVPIANFYSDAAANTLPQVVFLDPAFSPLLVQETDEHPPANPQVGQEFVAHVLGALMDSPSWPHSAFFLTYDEHGGFYDHVPPPSACVPDDIAPMLGADDVSAAFDRYGFRVPFVAVSPYARPGFVSHHVYDHTSILRFIETRFDLPALTNRDANADPLLDLFDFSNPALLNPPVLPEPSVDPVRAQMCAADFGR